MKVAENFSFMLAVGGGVLWGTYGTFSKIMGNMGIKDATISLISPLFLLVFFFILVIMDDKKKIKVPVRVLPVLILYGILSAIFNISLVKAYVYLPIGIVAIIVFCNLFLLMVLSYIFFKDRMTWKKFLAAVLAVVGIGMVLNVFNLNWSMSLTGIIWTVLAMTMWALMVTGEKYMLIHEVDGNAIMAYNGLFSVILISFLSPPWQSIANLAQSVTATGGMALLPTLALGLLTSAGCYFCYINALRNMEPAYVQMGFVMDPVTACILGFLVFGQELLPIQVAGIVLVLLLVIWVQWDEHKKEQAKIRDNECITSTK